MSPDIHPSLSVHTQLAILGEVIGVLWTVQSEQPGPAFFNVLSMAYGTSYYAISLGFNIVITLLIVIRLFQYKRSVARTMAPEHAQQYLSLAAVLVESSALYSLFALLFLITNAFRNPTSQVFINGAHTTQVRHSSRATSAPDCPRAPHELTP